MKAGLFSSIIIGLLYNGFHSLILLLLVSRALRVIYILLILSSSWLAQLISLLVQFFSSPSLAWFS